jgi:hypothetical protein
VADLAAGFAVVAADVAPFALVPELRETTLRAAAPARLAKDFLVADAMDWRPLSGEGMSCAHTWWREDMLRADPLQPAVPEHSFTVLAHWTHRTTWRGRVPDCTAMSELGTV